jgi:hypothetical protein
MHLAGVHALIVYLRRVAGGQCLRCVGPRSHRLRVSEGTGECLWVGGVEPEELEVGDVE